MGRFIMGLVVLGAIALAGLAAYATLADLSPAQSEIKLPVTLNAD